VAEYLETLMEETDSRWAQDKLDELRREEFIEAYLEYARADD